MSAQLRNLKKLCDRAGVKFFCVFENMGNTISDGNLDLKTVSTIIAEGEAQQPVTDLPKLPVNHAALYKGNNQQTMLDYANVLLKIYIKNTPIGKGKTIVK